MYHILMNNEINKKKVCVCLPSYNEADNIEYITLMVDKALKKISKRYECIIYKGE